MNEKNLRREIRTVRPIGNFRNKKNAISEVKLYRMSSITEWKLQREKL